MFEALSSWSINTIGSTEATYAGVTRAGLGEVCVALGAARGLYFGFCDGGATAVVEADWAAPGLPSAVGAEYTEAEAGGLFALLRRGQIVVCAADGQEPELAPLREILAAEGLVADAIIPVQDDGVLLRAVVIDFVEPPRAAAAELLRVCEGIQGLLAAAERRIAADALQRERERKLYHQQKLQSLGTMVGGILHDVNNVLQLVIGLSELMVGETDTKRQRSMAESISQAAMRGGDLCQRILIFSRQDFRPRETFPIGEHLRGMEPLLRSAVPEDRELVLRIEDIDRTVSMPVVELEQAVVNLCNNAVDATATGGRITISCRSVDEGAWVEVAVSDTGAGMDAATLQRAREAFFTTKPAGAGTGLGLAMVQRAVDDIGGSMTLESAAGAGTTATLRLPVSDPVEEVAPSSLDVAGGGETLLLVEDDAMILRVTASGLRRRGYTVLTARNGQVALSLLEAHGEDIALVITDVVMPVLGGVALYRAVAERTRTPPFLFATGYDAGHLVGDVAPAPGRAVLLKPYTARALQAEIRALLDI